ncbi:jg7959 [Pararge aegeria aegeria]|uniref:Jg7959 protein n=1 Tax=Pararge aegeria aegeria TaxID=348720 RepID=A0A8S4SME7_9NEOP|nr:jg7959 [Pararge aegeria aegeria]
MDFYVKLPRGHTEVKVELQMERWAARGGSVRLRCVHDVPPHLLDKVVFLRHGTKIFQYIRDRKPPYRNFTTPGAVLKDGHRNCPIISITQVALDRVVVVGDDTFSLATAAPAMRLHLLRSSAFREHWTMEIALATENSIILQNLDFAASGGYSCEVSLDTPIYTKASSEKQLTVFRMYL